MNGQAEKLRALYAGKSDGELLQLQEKSDGLTDTAQQALAEVLRERGLTGRSGDADTSLAAEDRSAMDDTVGEDEVLVYLFHDAFEAREAMRHMKEAGISHRMLDWHNVEPEMEVSQAGLDLGLVVRRAGANGALGVLKEKLGLFPAPEETSGEDAGDGLTALSMFDRDEGLVAAHALGRAGVTYLWRDGRDAEAHLPDEETVAIEVRPEDMERAIHVVETALGELPED